MENFSQAVLFGTYHRSFLLASSTYLKNFQLVITISTYSNDCRENYIIFVDISISFALIELPKFEITDIKYKNLCFLFKQLVKPTQDHRI